MKRIVITGFMGSGKTSVAAALARRLNCAMLDLDFDITKREGRRPANIIGDDGESAFRRIETNALRAALEESDAKVIALGGGTWTIQENRELIARHECLTVWLDTTFELCWRRIAGSGDSIRPLAPDMGTARALYDRRRASYQLANLRLEISGDDETAQAVAQIESELIGA